MYDEVVNERDHVIRPTQALKAKPISDIQKMISYLDLAILIL